MSSPNFPEPFRSAFGYSIFLQKYAHEGCETWEALARTLVTDVCGGLLPKSDQDQLTQFIAEMKFLPGGRYLYYAGRPRKFFNNCYLLRAEADTREDWADLAWKATSCLMTGGGIGVDYSIYRGSGSKLSATGGVASGPLSAMHLVNEIGRNVMQGGSRRSAIYASLSKDHPDIETFLTAKNWSRDIRKAKERDFNAPAPLDMTNISVNYGTRWVEATDRDLDPIFVANVRQALSSGDPGFSFNFHELENETLRNACD